MPRRSLGLVTILACAAQGCAEAPAGEATPSVAVAFARDFAGFERWTRFDRGLDPVPPTHLGHSVIYIHRMPAPGATEFPVGTRIVRVEEAGDDPSAWEVHAMVKRGAGFNRGGALNWEFFELVLDARREHPSIRWRGEGPASGDGYRPPAGGDLLSCNHCHAAATYNDCVLSPVLELSAMTSR